MTQPDHLTEIGDGEQQIPIRNVWYLLLYAWDMAALKGRWQTATEDSPRLLGLLARILGEVTRDLLRRQLGRAHSLRSQIVRGIRGRIKFEASLKRLCFLHGKANCSFSELSIDTLKNRILRSTLARLASDPRVMHPQPHREATLRHDLRGLVRALEGVSLLNVSSVDFSRLQLGQNDRDYALPLAICALIHRLEIPTETTGDHALAALLKNEIEFEKLFERFVQNFYKYHLHDHTVIRQKKLDWPDEIDCQFVPSMYPDITIIEKNRPQRRLIIDTKYSAKALSTNRFGGQTFSSPNLYQLYAYLRTQEERSESARSAEGMLLYPATDCDLTETMKVQGHIMRVVTVNLAQPWKNIEARLLELSRMTTQ